MLRAKVSSCCLGALLVLLGPADAGAQEDIHQPGDPPPVAEDAPPPALTPGAPAPQLPAPPPPALTTRYSRYRTRWYIGLGLGGGAGWLSDGDGSYTREGEGGFGFMFKVGWVARPWLLLGADLSGWRHDNDDSQAWIQYTHLDLVATIFPAYDLGLYGKAGAGLGVASFGLVGTGGERSEAGLDLKLGGGYEWQLMTSFNLGLDLTYALTAFEGGGTHDLIGSITCTWY